MIANILLFFKRSRPVDNFRKLLELLLFRSLNLWFRFRFPTRFMIYGPETASAPPFLSPVCYNHQKKVIKSSRSPVISIIYVIKYGRNRGCVYMVDAGMVRDALRECFGSALADDPGFYGEIVSLLRSWSPWKHTFRDFSRLLEDRLFNALYERLGPGMTLLLDNGTRRRILMSDLPSLSDRMMYPLFASLKPYSVNYENLRTYWMETGSPAAMRALYLFFSGFLPDQDRLMIERTVRENVPPSQRDIWLNLPKEG